MEYFSKKKDWVSWTLAIMVFMIHVSTFSNYTGYPIWAEWLNLCFQRSIQMAAVPTFFSCQE